MHTDLREHVDQTLRHGTQTAPSLLEGRNALLGALRQRIEEAVGVYIARMPRDDDDHPLNGRRGAGFAFAGSWSSRLHDCGFHANHVHPKGWISSCYYVAVPDIVLGASARQGWIKFGEPSFKTAMQTHAPCGPALTGTACSVPLLHVARDYPVSRHRRQDNHCLRRGSCLTDAKAGSSTGCLRRPLSNKLTICRYIDDGIFIFVAPGGHRYFDCIAQ